jgi:hypothetical protein
VGRVSGEPSLREEGVPPPRRLSADCEKKKKLSAIYYSYFSN